MTPAGRGARWAMGLVGLVLVAVPLGLKVLADQSQRQPPALGLVDGHLRPCAQTANCVNTEYPETSAGLVPPPADAEQRVVAAVEAMGGQITAREPGYLRAEFRSAWFGFVDDLEVRVDVGADQVHLRSASRAGRSDLGVNLARVQALIVSAGPGDAP